MPFGVTKIKNTIYARFGVEPERDICGVVELNLPNAEIRVWEDNTKRGYWAFCFRPYGPETPRVLCANPLAAIVATIRLARIAGISIPNRASGVSNA